MVKPAIDLRNWAAVMFGARRFALPAWRPSLLADIPGHESAARSRPTLACDHAIASKLRLLADRHRGTDAFLGIVVRSVHSAAWPNLCRAVSRPELSHRGRRFNAPPRTRHP